MDEITIVLNMDQWRLVLKDVFLLLGIVYFISGILDNWRWWNGTDENGKPR